MFVNYLIVRSERHFLMKSSEPLISSVKKGILLSLFFTLIGFCSYSQCNCPPVSSCGACQGGMTRLSFRFNDPPLLPLVPNPPASVTVRDGNNVVIGGGSFSHGDTFEVTADVEGNLFGGNEIRISILLGATEIIGTSCSTPIFVGDTFGKFEVIGGKSLNDIAICCAPEDMETIDPVITCPSNITTSLSAGQCTKTVTWSDPLATDNCGTPTLSSSHTSGFAFPRGTTTVTYTATDRYGNTANCSFTVTVNDFINPVITGCPTQDVTANASSTAGVCGANVSWTAPTVSDNCAVDLSLTSNKSPGDFFPVGTTLVTYLATDGAGRTATCSFNVVVTDVNNPVITGCPSTITLNADATVGTCGTNVTWTPPNVTDNCNVNMTSNKSPGDFFAVGTTVVTYIATDASGRQTTCSFNVVVNDVTNPAINGCPTTITVNANSAAGSCGTTVSWTPPTVSDNCSTGLNLTSNKAPGDNFPVGTTVVTYTATDQAGRQSTCSFNVVVNDVTAPSTTTCPTTITVNAPPTACSLSVSWTPPTFIDNCPVGMTVTSDKTPGSVFTVGTTLVTYTAKDVTGNESQCSFNVIVKDVTKPVISNCPSNISVNTTSCSAVVNWSPPTASDICGYTLTSNFSPGASFPVGVTTVVYTAIDPSNNVQTCSFTVTVRDNIPPSIVNCSHGSIREVTADNSCDAVVTWDIPSATDNCSVTLTGTHNSGDTFPLGTTDVVYTATDGSGNTSVCSFRIRVRDRTAPIISGCVSADITVNASSSCGAVANWTAPTASDNCNVTITSNYNPGDVFPIGTTLVKYEATDNAGNKAECFFNVIVHDPSIPVVSGCPANISVQLNSSTCTANVNWSPPSFTDNCVVTVTQTHSPGASFPLGITTVTYTGKDTFGNTATCSFDVVVTDASSPTLSNCPIDIRLAASANCTAVATWTPPTFSDNCSATMVGTHTSGQAFPVGVTAVRYTVTDGAGNQEVCSFNVTVVDELLPTIQGCPQNITVTMDAGACGKLVTWTPPTTADNCSVTLVSNFSPGHLFPEGTTKVIYTATDASGNSATCSFDVLVRDETVPIVSTCMQDIEVLAGSSCGQAVQWIPPVFTDNCGTLTIVSSHSPNDTFVVGVTKVTYTATDASANSATCEFNVRVIDQTNPTIVGCPSNITISATANCSAIVSWTAPTAADNCHVGLTSSHASGSTFALGTTVVTYTATDQSGNKATCSFNVTVVDESAPAFTSCPSTIKVSAGSSCKGIATWTTPVTSDCSDVTLSSTHQSGAEFSIGSTLVTYTATDANGKSATCSFTVIVEDKSSPVFTSCPANITVDAGATCDAVVNWTAPITTDNCGISSVTGSHQPGSVFPIGLTVVSYTATDLAGNASKCEFNVVVKNKSLPIITGCPSDIAIKVIDTDASPVTWDVPTASVECGSVTLTSNFSPGSSFPVGETVVLYKATDEAGNVSTCSFIVKVTYEDLEFTISQIVTPDGDGINDQWTLNDIEKFKENRVTVFDRWGSIVFAASGYDNQNVVWRGTNSSGGAVPTGTYFFTITVKYRGDYVERKGFIEVVR